MRREMTAAVLAMALLLTGCGSAPKTNSVSTEAPAVSTENVENSVENVENSGADSEKGQNSADSPLRVTVESVEISVETLKAQQYQVPLKITIDVNPGITYSEWGCAVHAPAKAIEASAEGADFSTVAAVADDGSAIWTAWSSGLELVTDPGLLLTLTVQLPEDAAPGDTFTVEYLETSPSGKPHAWSDGTNDWAGDHIGTDGIITVTE